MRATLALAFSLLGACMVGDAVVPDEALPFDDVEAGVTVLEGDALARDLRGSTVHEATGEFVRLGVIYDAAAPRALEVATSADGTTWSAWASPVVHHIEQEAMASFVGQLELPAGVHARFYRLRGQATFLRVEEMTLAQSQNLEGGDDAPETGSLAAQVGSTDVQPRSAWAARASRCSSPLGKVYRMAIHHTESPTVDKLSPEARLRQIQAYHMNVKGWCDIGYHYLVSRDGRVWQGRPVAKLGTHAGGANTGNIGISVMGTHDTTPVTATQIESLAGLVRSLSDQHGVAITRSVIKGHREYKDTSCPGDALVKQLEDILQVARAGESVATPPPSEPPPANPPPSTRVEILGALYAGEDTDARIAGATVKVGGQTVVTDAAGTWRVELAPGTFTVTASKPGYATRTLTRSTTGAQTWASFGLSPANMPTGTAMLQGVVYYGSNSMNRIPFAAITLSSGHTLTADGNGYYKLNGLPAGDVTITAVAAGYQTNFVTRTLTSGVTEWGSVKLAP